MQGEIYVDNSDGHKIDPATENNQREIVNELKQSVATNSLNFGTQKLTIGGDKLATGSDQMCRMCYISHTNSNATYVENAESGDADAASFLLPADVILELPIRNVNKLSFYGTAADTIHILWRD